MSKYFLLSLLLAAAISVRGFAGEPKLAVIPLPVSMEPGAGCFELGDGAWLAVDEGRLETANLFAAKVEARSGLRLEVVPYGGETECREGEFPTASGCVSCARAIITGDGVGYCGLGDMLPAGNLPGPGGYKLAVSSDHVAIAADGSSGLHNALMTVLQLMDSAPDKSRIPAVSILDYPRFQWRGMLIDSARSFHPPDVIKKYIDLLSELKLNVLHWHLVDDQGWRIESKVYPKLHQVGGVLYNQSDKKNRALDAHGWGRDNRGYYTQEELREIVAYAKERQVMIVPEIDVPGHTSAMIAAYPELTCSGEQIEMPQVGQLIRNAICPGKEEVYVFLDNLFGELATIFPSPYVHIGGDEVWIETWMEAPDNQWLIEEYGYTDKDGLQSYFTDRVNRILQKHGKTMVGWDEITEYLPEGAVVQAWRDHAYARVAAENGHDAIVSPTSHCYIDYPQLSFTLKNLYHFEPMPEGLDPSLASHILGGEVNLWGERVTMDNMDRKAFPRVVAHAEVMWTPPHRKDWNDFTARLKKVKKAMESRDVGFGVTWRDILFLL